MTFIDNINPLKISAAGDQRERFFKKMTFSTDSFGAELRSSRLVSAPRQKKMIITNKTKLYSAPNKALEWTFTRLHA
jgi:hypothetical protein